MGCGTSRAVQVMDEVDQDNLKEALDTDPPALISEATEELTSIHSNSPDPDSKPVEESNESESSPILRSNGTEPPSLLPESPPPEDSPEATEEEPEELPAPPYSAGRSIAFEVGSPGEQGADSLIKRHPPRKFQKLEDQQQNNLLTQEKLEEKQAIAEKRRQEILTQRVQSAKQRSARSAGRMRTRASDNDEIEQLEDGIIESAAIINPENEL